MKERPPSHEQLFNSPGRLGDLVSVPEALRQFLDESLERCHRPTENGSSIADRTSRLRDFVATQSSSKAKTIAVPHLRSEISDDLVQDIALSLRSGSTFLEMSQDAGWMEQPILLYYGQMQVIGAVTRAFFEWPDEDLNHHGVSSEKDGRIKVQPRGSFPRAMAFYSLCTSIPGAFDRAWVSTDNHPYLLNMAPHSSKIPPQMWSLSELLNHDGIDLTVRHLRLNQIEEVQFQYASQKTLLGIDLLIAFLASTRARYKPAQWMKIYHTIDGVLVNDALSRCRANIGAWLRFLTMPNRGGFYLDHYDTSGPLIRRATSELDAISG